MEFGLLGPLQAHADGRALALGGPKQRALLAVLLLNANEVVPTDRLIDEVWGETPPATVAKSVQAYVSRLRRAMDDGRLVTRAPGYLLRVERSELDLTRFEDLAHAAGIAPPDRAAGLLRDALALWRGPPLADLAGEPFARSAVARLDELRLAAVEARIDADLEMGRHAALAGELESLIAAHPLRPDRRRARHRQEPPRRGAPRARPSLPELRAIAPDLPAPADGDGGRFRFFEAASALLIAAARRAPVVVVLDDLHAADEPSLLLLRFVARAIAGAPVLLVCAFRDVDPTLRDPLATTLAHLVREPGTARIELTGWTAGDVAAFIAQTSGALPRDRTVTTIHVETEGNPLFVTEVVRLLGAGTG